MTRRDSAELLLLAAIWGASFLFMRLGAGEFGPVALAFVRALGATLLLVPMMLLQRQRPGSWRELITQPRRLGAIALVGLVGSALPFLLYGVAALVLSTALMSVFNATAAIWGALIAWWWLHEKPEPLRLVGMAIGLAGVVGLAWGKADVRVGPAGVSAALGVAACIGATMLYGVAANASRHWLRGASPLAVACGSQIAAALLLAVPAAGHWPAASPGLQAWGAALALAFLCTGVAYYLYFRLIARIGASQAMSVTFLIPAFALLWGFAVLGEVPTVGMLLGCAVILLGTAMAAGILRWPQR